MSEIEGVIKYPLQHRYTPLPKELALAEINAWRTIMVKLDLIGQHPQRYGGYGFGNISQRVQTADLQFIISGTQTGHLQILEAADFCLVTYASPKDNQIISCGESKPSSEALTHASVYQQNPHIQAVIHVHCPEIWRHTQAFQLAHTAADIAYGTPEMAEAVTRLFKQQNWQQTAVFSMLGHEDGIVAFGCSLNEAATTLINQFSKALKIEQSRILL